MVPTRLVTFAALTCTIPALISCAHQSESVDRQVELQLAEHHTSCLSPARPGLFAGAHRLRLVALSGTTARAGAPV